MRSEDDEVWTQGFEDAWVRPSASEGKDNVHINEPEMMTGESVKRKEKGDGTYVPFRLSDDRESH